MATWQDIGIDNYRAALQLYDDAKYRSAVSRFYYAAFSLVTYELIRRNAAADFRDGRSTPGHAQLPRLVETYFTHLSDVRLANLVSDIGNLYRSRLAADYSMLRVDKQAAKQTYRTAEVIFRYLGVTP